MARAHSPPAEATVFETGSNDWRTFDAWPPRDVQQRRIYLHENGKLEFVPPRAPGAYDEFVSDPARPVPFTEQITPRMNIEYMVEDQRFAARRPDVLVEHYRELIGDWEVDLHYLLYAAESDPLDSYRSISAIDQRRAETYGELGGSSTIVSPLGSKMLSVGLMLAALERKLRVMYVESRGYEELAMPVIGAAPGDPLPLTHLWLHGEIYRAGR